MFRTSRLVRTILTLVVGIVVLYSAVWALPILLTKTPYSPDRMTAINDVRTTLVQLLAGGFLFAGLYFTARTLRLNREGQITDRFSRAVDQLGNRESSDVRIGGIYALERILRESPGDHQPIVEILTAFVRQHATNRGEVAVDPNWERGTPIGGLDPLCPDVQAALTVLGRRPERDEPQRLDLRRTDLRLAFLHGARFDQAILGGARLDYADLGEIKLRDAALRRTSFVHAWMRAAQLDRADFRDADFRWAALHDASLRSTRMWTADFTGADLSGAVEGQRDNPESSPK
jgi:Pentapeptide repeats (9 copies)